MTGFGNLAVISPAVIVVASVLWLLARIVRPAPITVRPTADLAQHRAVLARYGVSTGEPPARRLTLVPSVEPDLDRHPDARPSTAA